MKSKFVFGFVIWLVFCTSITMAQEPTDENAKKADEIYQELQILLDAGRNMESLRQSDKGACGEQMRANQQKVEELQTQADSLPNEYILLKAATGQLRPCVSCSESALARCDIAEDDLKYYITSISEEEVTNDVTNSEIDDISAWEVDNKEITTENNIPVQVPTSGGIIQHEPIQLLFGFSVLMIVIGYGVFILYRK
jgi:hypothetical protein